MIERDGSTVFRIWDIYGTYGTWAEDNLDRIRVPKAAPNGGNV